MPKTGEYTATVKWTREGAQFTDNRYSRVHEWVFDGGVAVRASASPHIVPEPLSSAAAVDPEEAFVASLSSCHMLWVLSIAAKKGWVIDSYEDNAVGRMARNASGKLMISDVILRPVIRFAGSSPPSKGELDELHHLAHEECFLAASVRTNVTVESS